MRRAFDFQITFQKVRFLAQGDLLGFAHIQGAPQESAEADQDFVGGVRRFVDQGRDRVQGVEEEMRIELHGQQIQSGLDELGGERGGLMFPFASNWRVAPAA